MLISFQPVVQSWDCQIYVSPTNNRPLHHWNPPPQMCLDPAFISLNHSQEKDSLDLAPHSHTHIQWGVENFCWCKVWQSYFSHVILHGGRCHVKLHTKDKTTSQVVPVLHGLHGDSEKRHAPPESLGDSSLHSRKEQNMLSGLLALSCLCYHNKPRNSTGFFYHWALLEVVIVRT